MVREIGRCCEEISQVFRSADAARIDSSLLERISIKFRMRSRPSHRSTKSVMDDIIEHRHRRTLIKALDQRGRRMAGRKIKHRSKKRDVHAMDFIA